MNELPIYKIKGKFYFLDKRLCEYRNIKNPSDRLNFNSVSLEDLEKPTEQDKNIFIEMKGGFKKKCLK
jgi:hypothetical protein